MRIIAGKYKGRKIKSMRLSEQGHLRPTTDKLREALFSILGRYIEGSKFLDIFAGTGSIGIEALSRGASDVYFIERDKRTCKLIYDNLKTLSVEDNKYRVICSDYMPAIKRLGSKNLKFDFIYADPPYKSGYYLRIVSLIRNFNLLEDDGLLILEERSKASVLSDNPYLVETRRYGNSSISFLNFAEKKDV